MAGQTDGRYVSTLIQNNPTYEFFPKQGAAIDMQFLTDTVPLNLFPLTWLMPSGKPVLTSCCPPLIPRQGFPSGVLRDDHVRP
jgi:hypothetical protein